MLVLVYNETGDKVQVNCESREQAFTLIYGVPPTPHEVAAKTEVLEQKLPNLPYFEV